jgi:hypothetical protein
MLYVKKRPSQPAGINYVETATAPTKARTNPPIMSNGRANRSTQPTVSTSIGSIQLVVVFKSLSKELGLCAKGPNGGRATKPLGKVDKDRQGSNLGDPLQFGSCPAEPLLQPKVQDPQGDQRNQEHSFGGGYHGTYGDQNTKAS